MYEYEAKPKSPNSPLASKRGELTHPDDTLELVLGMPRGQVLAIWDEQGKPIIHLGPGENCYDLAKLLPQRDIKPQHLSAIKEWLEQHSK